MDVRARDGRGVDRQQGRRRRHIAKAAAAAHARALNVRLEADDELFRELPIITELPAAEKTV